MKRAIVASTLVGLLTACDSEVITSFSPVGSSRAASSSASSGGASTATTSMSAGGAGGMGGMGGQGGASGIEMVIGGYAPPVEHVTLSVMPSEYIGGINRWVFDFRWLYDDPMLDDETQWVDFTVRIMRTDPMFEPSETEATYLYPEDDGNPLEMLPGAHVLFGVIMKTTTVIPTAGVFSIRRIGNQFDGYVSIDGMGQDTTRYTVHVAGPFVAPVP